MTKDNKIEPEKLELRSLSPAVERRAELLRLFPEARTEGGKIDFDRVEARPGRDRRSWERALGLELAGQSRMLQDNPGPQPRHATPGPEESVNFDTTENLIIEGDNLEVLKLCRSRIWARSR